MLAPFAVEGQLYIGATSGYGISSIEFTPTMKESSLFDGGIDVGLTVKYFDLQYFGFKGDLIYTRRGYRKPIDESINYKRINTYLDLPMFMQIRITKSNFFLHLNLGCYGSLLLSSVDGNNESGSYLMQPYKLNILRDNRFDYGLSGTLGFGYESPIGVFQIDFKYSYGLADLYLYNYPASPSRSPSRIQGISLSYLVNLSEFIKKRGNPLGNLSTFENELD